MKRNYPVSTLNIPVALTLLCLLFIGAVLRIHGLDLRSFYGDEYNSLRELHRVGSNPQSVLFFMLLNLWSRVSMSEWWLRLFSAVWGTLWIPAMYYLGRVFKPESVSVALGASLLACFSAFAIGYSQMVRFYSLFLLLSTLSYALFLEYMRNFSKLSVLYLLVITNIALLCTHFFGWIVVGIEALVFYVYKGDSRKRAFGVLALFLSCIAVIAFLPSVRDFGWNLIQGVVNNVVRHPYSGAKGFHWGLPAKIPMAYYFFSFGEFVYPLNAALVVPGTALFISLFLTGAASILRDRLNFLFAAAGLITPFLLMHLVLDILAPSQASTGVRHAIFVLPIYYLVLASALAGASKFKAILIALAIVIISSFSILMIWRASWHHGMYLLTDWRAAADFALAHYKENTLIVHDGRSEDPLNHYFRPDLKRENYWDYREDISPISGYDRLIVTAYEWRAENRVEMNRFLSNVSKSYSMSANRMDYPMFQFVFDRVPAALATEKKSLSVALPAQIPGIAFKDLKFPFEAQGQTVTGVFTMANDESLELDLSRMAVDSRSRLVILSNLTNSSMLKSGEEIASITATSSEGPILILPVKKGVHTENWTVSDPPRDAKFSNAYQWTKRLALVGENQYPESWKHFQASIYRTEFDLTGIERPKSLTIKKSSTEGNFHVYAVEFSR